MKKNIVITFAVIAVLLIIASIGSRSLISSHFANLGREALNAGNYEEAKIKLDKAVSFNSANAQVEAYLGRWALGRADALGTAYYPEADYSTAILHYEKAFSLDLKGKESNEVYRQALENAGFAYWSSAQYDQAVAKYLEEIEIAPNRSFWPRYFVATDYFERVNKPREALEILTPAPDLAQSALEKRQLPNVYLLLAWLYDYAGDLAKAREAVERALASVPQNERASPLVVTAYTRLSTIDARMGKLDAALQAYAKLESLEKSLNQEKGNYTCTLARIYFQAKDYEKAGSIAKSWEEGRKTTTLIDALCFDTLTRIEMAAGNKDTARQYAQKYISIVDASSRLNALIQRTRAEFTSFIARP